ncbi:MAG: cobaltochelatase subunit CobN [Desulfurispora sp.]|uniref:cobaltochelatase subunit CobN n=1 Tax=Desulfurispora sp. TaxID=3014275 RepID=UPI00404A77F9
MEESVYYPTVQTDQQGQFTLSNLNQAALLLYIPASSLPDQVSPIQLRVAQGSPAARLISGQLQLSAGLQNGTLTGQLTFQGVPLTGVTIQCRPVLTVLLIAWPTEAPQMRLPMQMVHERYPEVEFIARSTTQLEENLAELPGLVQQADLVYISNVTPGSLEAALIALKDQLAGKQVAAYMSPYYSYPVLRLTNFAGTQLVDRDGNPLSNDQLGQICQSVSQVVYPQTPLDRLNELSTQYPAMAKYFQAWQYRVADCASPENRAEMLLYLLQQAGYPAYQAQPPRPVAPFFLYRQRNIFYSFEQYAARYWHADRPAVGLTGWSPLVSERGDEEAWNTMIMYLENRGFNVIPLLTQGNPVYGLPALQGMQRFFLDSSGRSRVFAVVNQISFKLGGEQAAAVEKFLQQHNLLVIRAITDAESMNKAGQSLAEWQISDRGINWPGVASQVTLPEMQGQIEPILVGTNLLHTDPLSGLRVNLTQPVPERMQRLADRLYNWYRLRQLDNAQKKIALIYYNYPPGKQNIGASYLNTPASLMQILQSLQQNGYQTGELPANEQALLERLLQSGINVATWAPGELARLADHVLLWEAEKYRQWYEQLPALTRRSMEEGPLGYIQEVVRLARETGENKEIHSVLSEWHKALRGTIEQMNFAQREQALTLLEQAYRALQDLLKGQTDEAAFTAIKKQFLALQVPGLCGWGPPPGQVMTVSKEGRNYLVIPGFMLGNIFVGPQPQRGYEADSAALYHSQVVPPHHQYLAFYAYLQKELGVHALVHLGRHGTYEWLPRKEVALSNADYPDICVGDLPSIYPYIMDGVGEVLHAKRRGLAVSISHLTPPLQGAELYGDAAALKTLLEQYQAASPEMKDSAARELRQQAAKMHLENNLTKPVSQLNDAELVEQLEAYLEELANSWLPLGLHTFGRPWTREQLVTMLSSMAAVPSLPAGMGQFVAPAELLNRYGNNLAAQTIGQLVDGNSREQVTDQVLATAQAAQPDLPAEIQTQLIQAVQKLHEYTTKLQQSPQREMEMLLRALNGDFIPAAPGNDPLRNPAALPTGGNLYGLDPGRIPTPAALARARELARQALQECQPLPEQMGVVVWATETQTDSGTTVAFIMQLLGVEPIYGYGMNVLGVRALPLEQLQRPRLDVLMSTSGIFRETFPQVAILLDRSVRAALAASYLTIKEEINRLPDPDRQTQARAALEGAVSTLRAAGLFIPGSDPLEQNHVARHWLADLGLLLDQGMSGDQAGRAAITRLFGPSLGAFGTNLPDAVRMAQTWQDRQQLGNLYIDSMQHAYREDAWGEQQRDIFTQRLKDTGAVFHSRSTSLYGLLDVDHNFEYLGGFGLAVEAAGGKAPGLFVLNQQNPAGAKVESAASFLQKELAARYFNPDWIKAMMEQGYAGAREMAHGFVDNLWGWNIVAPQLIADWHWQKVKEVYLDDQYGLGLKEWFNQQNRGYSLIEITGTMLTAAHKGFWQTDRATLKQIADTWARAIIQNGAACCDCSCGNLQMMRWASTLVDANLLSQLTSRLEQATGVVLSERSRHKSKKSEHPVQQPASQTVPQPAQPEQNQPPLEQPAADLPPAGEQSNTSVLTNTSQTAPTAAREDAVQPAGPSIAMAEQESTSNEPPISLPATASQKPAAPGPGEKQGGNQPPLKAYEVQKETTKTAPPRPTVPLLGFIGVLALVVLSGIGFALHRRGR